MLVAILLILPVFFIYGCTPKPKKIAETDSTQNFISAEYCFYKEFKNDSTWEWEFSPYKIINPLNLKLPEMCERGYYYSADIDSKDSLCSSCSPLGSLMGGMMGSVFKEPVESILNVYPIMISYSEIGIPLLQKEDTTKILDLAGKSFLVKWKFNLSCKEKEVFNLQGTYYIRISGICTEEQLKIIEYGEDNE